MEHILAQTEYPHGDKLVAQHCHHVFWNREKGKSDTFKGFEVMYLESAPYEGENCYNVVSSEYFLTEEEALAAYNIRRAGRPAQWSKTFPKSMVELVSGAEM